MMKGTITEERKNDNGRKKERQTMLKKKTTLKDVAREAGVSAMTVSHVLNGKHLNHASPENRKRIFETARRLNYKPNLAARQLVTRRSNLIGILIDSMAPSFYRDVMMHAERAAFARGYRLQIGMIHENFNSIQQYTDDFIGSGIENVICMAHTYPDFGAKIPKLMESFQNVVFLEEPFVATRFPVVATDHRANFLRAVSGLIEHGRLRIFSLRTDYRDKAFQLSCQGMQDAFRLAGLPFEEQFWAICRDDQWHTFEDAETAIVPILRMKPDALILSCDESSLRALQVLNRRGIRVPEDMAVFSAELGNYGRAATPAFSGIAHDSRMVAQLLMEKLLERIEDVRKADLPGKTEYVPADIVWNQSC